MAADFHKGGKTSKSVRQDFDEFEFLQKSTCPPETKPFSQHHHWLEFKTQRQTGHHSVDLLHSA